ncbi:hypothetical protein BSKO_13790 [Bryopsis sp. KO-2023]|nr:hypothetical protein BSKO_13790 [Bryopsis sp. KO-2023]
MSVLRTSFASNSLRNVVHSSKSPYRACLVAKQRRLLSGTTSDVSRLDATSVVSGNGATESTNSTSIKNVGFGFSAGGLVFPYLVGTTEGLSVGGLLTRDTPCAGASAGSLVAALYHSGMSSKDLMDGALELSADCREYGTRGRLKQALENTLRELLPQDAHIKCSGKAHVAITQVYPFNDMGGYMVSEFDSREDLIQTLLTSCHIPMWFNNRPFTRYRQTFATDGGLVNFIPGPSDTDRVIRVCCFPARSLGPEFGIDLAPDTFSESKYSMSQLLSWAFEPAEEEVLWELYEMGKRDGLRFARSSDLLEVQPPVDMEKVRSGTWARLRSVLTRTPEKEPAGRS